MSISLPGFKLRKSHTVPIKLITPHFRPSKGTGSKSKLVHRALPSAKADWVCETRNRGRVMRMTGRPGVVPNDQCVRGRERERERARREE